MTRIRAQRVGYPRICGYFVPVAIFKLEREEEERRERRRKKRGLEEEETR